jgi:hypothetical protein
MCTYEYVPQTVFSTMLRSRINAYAQWNPWFIFNLRMKKGSVICIHTHCYNVIHLHNSLITLCFIHTWVARRWQHLNKWVHPCSLLKADWLFSPTTWDRMLRSFPWIAWLGYFFFPSLACPDFGADCSPNSNTYKSQRYTSRPDM